MINYCIHRWARSEMQARVLVFNYHNILPSNAIKGLIGTPILDFNRQIAWIQKHFQILPLDCAIEECRRGLLKAPTAAITFDDAYETQRTLGASTLKAAGIPATFFVSSGHLGHNIMWNDWFRLFAVRANPNQWKSLGSKLEIPLDFTKRLPSCRELKDIETNIKYRTLEQRKPITDFIKEIEPANSDLLRMMDEHSIKQLADSGFEIGAHSLSHPILKLEVEAEAEKQIVQDINNLNSIVGGIVTSFAIPNGKPSTDYTNYHLKLLSRNGIRRVMSSSIGHFSPGYDPMQVARVCLTGRNELEYLRSCRQAYCAPTNIVPGRGYENRTQKHSL